MIADLITKDVEGRSVYLVEVRGRVLEQSR
jgi:hypothetical protein